MNFRIILVLILAGYCLLCGVLVLQSGLFENGCTGSDCEPRGIHSRKPDVVYGCIVLQHSSLEAADKPAGIKQVENADSAGGEISGFTADNALPKTLKLGSTDPKSGFKFAVELTSRGASIVKALLSEFDDRDYKNPRPLKVLSPVRLPGGSEILSMASRQFVFVDKKLQLSLDKLCWEDLGVQEKADGSQVARFGAVIKTLSGEPVIKLKKTYKVAPGSYQLDCNLAVENLCDMRTSAIAPSRSVST